MENQLKKALNRVEKNVAIFFFLTLLGIKVKMKGSSVRHFFDNPLSLGTCQKLETGRGGGNFKFGFGNEVTHPCNGSKIC